jgi:Caspase domain
VALKKWPLLVCLAALLIVTGPRTSCAEKRAFAVGIDHYGAVNTLRTAIADAVAVSMSLNDLGFTVELLKDPDRAEFDRKWSAFLGTLHPGDVVAFYFAGHGMQVDGANYLLPKDTPGPDAADTAILEKSLNFHEVMEQLEARHLATTLYILDACRNNPFKPAGAKRARSTLGQTKGLAPMESVYGAFVMYSAGPDEQATDSVDERDVNSIYVRRLLPLLRTANLSLVDIAKRVQVQVEEDARSVSVRQRPAYFDGIVGQYYLGQLAGRTLGPAERIPGDNVVRLGAFATWDSSCKSRPAPRINVTAAPKYGRIITRFETFVVGGLHFGNLCEKSTQRGIGVYYIVDDANAESTAIDQVQFAVKHWSVAPVTTVNEGFEIDLATRYGKRTTKP